MSTEPQKDLEEIIAKHAPAHSRDHARAILKGVFEAIGEMRRSVEAGPNEPWEAAFSRYTEKTLAEAQAKIDALAVALFESRQWGSDADTLCWCAGPVPCRGRERQPRCVANVAALRRAGKLE